MCVKVKKTTVSEIETFLEAINVIFDMFSDVINQFDSIYKQNNFFSHKFGLIPPCEIVLGTRIDQRYQNANIQGISNSFRVTETFQYVPIKNTSLQLFKQTNFKLWFERNQKNNDKMIRLVHNGLKVKKNELLSNNSIAIQIQLYYDDQEGTNPLGSKTKIYELGIFYNTILNLPQKYTSKLSNIFLLAAVYTNNIKKYGFDPISRPFVKEIHELESISGMKLETNFSIRGCLTMVVADILAAHLLLEFQSPSANYCCRLCYAEKEQINFQFREANYVMRTPVSQDILLQDKLPNRGVAKSTCLESLNHSML